MRRVPACNNRRVNPRTRWPMPHKHGRARDRAPRPSALWTVHANAVCRHDGRLGRWREHEADAHHTRPAAGRAARAGSGVASAQEATKAPAAAEPTGTTPDVAVTDLTLGMYVTQDRRIAVPMTTFRPEDTISLCIATVVPPGAARSGTIGIWGTYGESETLRSLKTDVDPMMWIGRRTRAAIHA